MRIAIWNWGRGIHFGSKARRHEGDYERIGAIKLLASRPGVDHVLLLCKTNWSKMPGDYREGLDPHGKVETLEPGWEPDYKVAKDLSYDDQMIACQGIASRLLMANRKIDFGIAWTSQFPGTNTPLLRNTRADNYGEGIKLNSALWSNNAPQAYALWVLGVPWVYISTDPRITRLYDRKPSYYDVPPPLAVICPENRPTGWICKERFDGAAPLVDYEIPTVRSNWAWLSLALGPQSCVPPTDRSGFAVVCNPAARKAIWPDGSLAKDFRYDILERFILPLDPPAEIYGHWHERRVNGNAAFRGGRTAEEIDAVFSRAASTFVMPMSTHGWVTCKYAEMLRMGVMPWLHPDYDKQQFVFPRNHPLRVRDAADLADKLRQPSVTLAAQVASLQKALVEPLFKHRYFYDSINQAVQSLRLAI